MDFAENYSCMSVEEIQTAYWNHPVVVYYKKNRETQHKSYVVSDEMSHSPCTVHAIIDKPIPELKLLSPELACSHYWIMDQPANIAIAEVSLQ